MRRLPAAAAVWFAFSSPLQGEAIRGTVIAGNGGAPIPHAEVAFFTSSGDQVVEVVRKEADEQGRFAFSGPFLTLDLTFVLVAMYQGVPYPSSELRVDGQTEILLEVYEPSDDNSTLRVSSHAIIVGMSSTAVEVGHFVQVENLGERTYIGTGSGTERRVTEFALPEDVFNLTGTVAAAGDGRYFDNRPLPPGSSQVSFNFQLDPGSLDLAYPHRAIYATDVLDLYVQPSSTEPGDFFEDLGTTDLHGVEYRHMRATNLRAGQTVSVPVDLPKPVRWMLKWVALAAAGVGGVLTLATRPRARGIATGTGLDGRVPAGDRQTLEKHQRGLLQQIADLDDAHAADQEDATYSAERETVLRQVVALRRRLLEADVERRG